MTEPEPGPEMQAFLERAMPLLAGPRHLPQAQTMNARPRSPQPGGIGLTPLAGDGSRRRIYRATLEGTTAVVVFNPLPSPRTHPDENESFHYIHGHLSRYNIRVPRLFAADPGRGLFLMEDLGDSRIYDLAEEPPNDVRAKPESPRRNAAMTRHLYRQAIDALVAMQESGATFEASRVFSPTYTEPFILEQEAAYFHRELVQSVGRQEVPFSLIEEEARTLARDAILRGPHGPHLVFMHRDYQSRNLMVVGGPGGDQNTGVVVIDFQGARCGPAEYDVAALLWDPYIALPAALRREVLLRYLRRARYLGIPGIPELVESPGGEPEGAVPPHAGGADESRDDEVQCGEDWWDCSSLAVRPDEWEPWRRRFLANSANRLLQALGAFAKLGIGLQRPGFAEYIPTGLRRLIQVLASRRDCPRLLGLARQLADQFPFDGWPRP